MHLAVLLLLPLLADAQIALQWDTEYYYGFDGPWQAVQVDIAPWFGSANADIDSAQVSLIPSTMDNNFVISGAYCTDANDDSKGISVGISVDTDCPGSNGTAYPATDGGLYEIQCGIEYLGQPTITFKNVTTDSFEDCVAMCPSGGATCIGVSYFASSGLCIPMRTINGTVAGPATSAVFLNFTTPPGQATCQTGNTWNPTTAQDQEGIALPGVVGLDYSGLSGPSMSGTIYAYNIGIHEFAVSNTSSVLVTSGNTTLPNGTVVPLDAGFLGLGNTKMQQTFVGTNGSVSTNNTITGLTALGITDSVSYGLHLGSAAYRYGGSLVYGGFDQGRAIGPLLTWDYDGPFIDSAINALQLTDIVIGVEAGYPPFPFNNKTGLLSSNSSQNVPINVQPDPTTSYLHLPKKTCDNIAALLPVDFDAASGFYIWQNNSLAATIVSSPAWLGFEFLPPPSYGNSTVLIKVPFGLLYLQLLPPAVVSPVHYFPCMPYDPAESPGQQIPYLLGRAFLQGAFLGRNYGSGASWLAQAPGPGALGQGIGSQLVAINNSDTTIDLYTDTTLLNKTWSAHWTPLTEALYTATNSTVPPSTASTSNSSDATSSPISSKSHVAVAVGASIGGVAAIALLGGVAAFFLRRRRKIAASSASSQVEDKPQAALPPELHGLSSPMEMQCTRDPTELNAAAKPSELEGLMPQELDAAVEMEGSGVGKKEV